MKRKSLRYRYNNIRQSICLWLLKKAFGAVPQLPSVALWQIIDEETKKEEPDCVYVEAWLVAIKRVKDYK